MQLFRISILFSLLALTTTPNFSTTENNLSKSLTRHTDNITPKVKPKIIEDPVVIIEDISDSLYNEIIEHIKESESFRGCIYIDTDGSPTIGYGHHLKKGESFPDTITEEHATQLLKSDFNLRVKNVKDKRGLSGNKAHAIALFIYNCGSGTYARSSLKIAIENEEPIDDIIVQYCKYKSNGVYHFSKGLLERREFELEIYNS